MKSGKFLEQEYTYSYHHISLCDEKGISYRVRKVRKGFECLKYIFNEIIEVPTKSLSIYDIGVYKIYFTYACNRKINLLIQPLRKYFLNKLKFVNENNRKYLFLND